MISYNVEGLLKHLHTVAEMIDNYHPSIVMMQETKCHKLEELSIASKIGRDRYFTLNSNDQYQDVMAERLETNSSTAIHGTGMIINKEKAGKDFKIYDPTTPRIQHMRLNNINYINTYLPTRDDSAEGQEKLLEALGDLETILEPLRGEPILIAGDFNVGKHHGPWRKDQFTKLFSRHNLEFHSPQEPTNFPRGKGIPAALDHLACTNHFTNVTYEILDRSKVPINVSTHVPVKWCYTVHCGRPL